MIPSSILDYLNSRGVAYAVRSHPRAVGAQQLAHAMHVPGARVCKSVLVDLDGAPWIATLPATAQIDLRRLAESLDARHARLLAPVEFVPFFPGCEVGAEPPFGGLYGLPVVADASLCNERRLIVRAGSHTQCLEMEADDFFELEQPRIRWFSAQPERSTAAAW